jgi:hypothetical protein
LIYKPEIAWIKGPIRGGKGDHEIFKEDGLKDKLTSTPNKMGIADGGYEMAETENMGILCLPNNMNSRELRHFKLQAHCHHESLNGRLNNLTLRFCKINFGME